MTNIMMIDRIETALSDLNYFCGVTSEEIFAELEPDMLDYEILYTLENLLEQVQVRLIESGRTYDAA